MEFDLNTLMKRIEEANDRLNKTTIVPMSELMAPVAPTIRSMSYTTLSAALGPFSMDFRVEMRKRLIEMELGEKNIFPTKVKIQEGKEVLTIPKFKMMAALRETQGAF